MPETAPQSTLNIPPFIFGTMSRASRDPNLRKAMFRYALKQGVRAFDTAPLYGFGETESQLGEVLHQSESGDPIQVYSKVGLSWRADSRGPVHFETLGSDGRTRTVFRDSRPATVRSDVLESLSRLGIDQLDLVQVHFRDEQTPVADTMAALRELREEGLVKEIGVSNFTLDEVQEAVAALHPVPLAAVQLRLNLLQRQPLEANGPVAWCRERGIRLLAYSPLAEGRLARPPREQTGDSQQLSQAILQLTELAAGANLPMSAIAIAWLNQRSRLTAPIAGASTPEQLDGLLAFTDVSEHLVTRAAEIFTGVQLLDAWEGPTWKRKLRGLKRRLLRR